MTPSITKLSLSSDLSSFGKTDEIAKAAADAPQIAIAPPISMPNLYWYGSLAINTAFTVKFIAAGFLLILSFAMNIHVYTASKNNLPPNKFIVHIP